MCGCYSTNSILQLYWQHYCKNAAEWAMMETFALHSTTIASAFQQKKNFHACKPVAQCRGFRTCVHLTCQKVPQKALWHNEVRDTVAGWMVTTPLEPTLQPISGEVLRHATAIAEEGARLDIATDGFSLGHYRKGQYFDSCKGYINPCIPLLQWSVSWLTWSNLESSAKWDNSYSILTSGDVCEVP